MGLMERFILATCYNWALGIFEGYVRVSLQFSSKSECRVGC